MRPFALSAAYPVQAARLRFFAGEPPAPRTQVAGNDITFRYLLPSSFLKQTLDIHVRVEEFQIVEALTDADELHWQIELALDAEDGAALGRTVEFGQDNA